MQDPANDLAAALDAAQWHTRSEALRYLGEHPTTALKLHATAVVGRIADSDSSVRSAAVTACKRLGAVSLVEHVHALTQLLQDTSWPVRLSALQVLSSLPESALSQVASSIQPLVEDSDSSVREAATQLHERAITHQRRCEQAHSGYL